MLQYKVVCVEANTLSVAKEKLERDVANLIEEGWKLKGGVGISSVFRAEMMFNNFYYCLTQAMIKEE